ncbi:scavenger receptor cysteine-rich type 1 protein M160 [Cyprinodon tularosa]|uniref:scavenger receptor cysteine-rich type 1 protein M160 n=1 Tax=Cyprinodon tularosa TaxID=77115 RepID=UPI0018E21467|nr:scavenger receptor cysteine-rich type 1 protein M160 [Cyprinodon tularosa]
MMELMLLLLLHTLAYFTPTGSADPKGRIILRSGESPCEGHVEAYYEDKKTYVGDKYWNANAEEVVCRSTHCGKPISSTDVYRPLKSRVVLNELKCQGNEASLWDCPGWPGSDGFSFYKKPTVKKISCSDKIVVNVTEKLPSQCEGTVQYSVNSKDHGYICEEEFGKREADILCKNIDCGEWGKILRPEEILETSKMKSINCEGIEDVTHPWQCVKSAPKSCKRAARITCKDHKRMQLRGHNSNVCSGQLERENENGEWIPVNSNSSSSNASELCSDMHCGANGYFTHSDNGLHLTCSDQVQVVLTDAAGSDTKCYGEVRIKVNNITKAVCGNGWNDTYYDMICKELNCGKNIGTKMISVSRKAMLDHVECSGTESSLWHCRAKHQCDTQCSNVPYVICSESVSVNLRGGPGHLAGTLEVEYEGKWKTAFRSRTDNSKLPKLSQIVCEKLRKTENGTKRSSQNVENSNKDSLVLENWDSKTEISDCISKNKQQSNSKGYESIDITCPENKVLFLHGNQPCSGTVGIMYKEKKYSLSWSNQTWNIDLASKICQELHCGNASKISSSTNIQSDGIIKPDNCLSSNKSLVECELEENSASNQTFAAVECTGTISVSLTNTCWGYVSITTADKKGSVAEDAWEKKMSEKLCKELSCGSSMPSIDESPKEGQIAFKSLHDLNNVGTDRNLNQYSLVYANGSPTLKQAYVVCKKSIKPRFKPSRDHCSGNVEVLYEGLWLPVHKDALKDENTQKTICEELECGAGWVQTTPHLGPLEKTHLIKELQCDKSRRSLAMCKKIAAEKADKNIIKASDLGGLFCSNWSKMALEVEDSCKGKVVVYSGQTDQDEEAKRSFVSFEGWTQKEGEMLCKDLHCGPYINIKPIKDAEINSLWNKKFSCSGREESIWECKTEPNNNTKTEKVILECKGEPKVALSKGCSGELTIDNKRVCMSQWTDEDSHRVCQELNCGNSIYSQPLNSKEKSFHVHCDEHHYRIGQCQRVEAPCDTGTVFLTCAGGVGFRASDGCGGVLLVNYKGEPETLCQDGISETIKEELCKELVCNNKTQPIKNKKAETRVETSLVCPNNRLKNLRYCINDTCSSGKSANIQCVGYTTPPPSSPPTAPPDPIPIVVGVLLCLILVVLIVIFVRYRINRRKMKAMRPPADMEEADWDSGEYEDVDKSDEVDSFRRGRFKSDSEGPGEGDVDSRRSYNYDDIDEVAEDQPLTPQGSVVHATKPDKTDKDSVTYEVEESQENYDDIDASPEDTETTAEVHDGPRPAPEGDAGVPKEQAQNNEDYLVPGQDG